MKRQIITTKDGSHTVEIPEMQVTYHSHHGAVQESMHVFIEAGLRWWLANGVMEKEDTVNGDCAPGVIRIFEMGLGTGLNAYLTALEADRYSMRIRYTAVEKFPLTPEEAGPLNYGGENKLLFYKIHDSAWEIDVPVTQNFVLHKHRGSLEDFGSRQLFDIIYFDAFAPAAQPELWTEAIFSKLFRMLNTGGVLVTYCSKGVVRRAMQAAGFAVTKIPGPPGKREMVRAIKGL